MNKRILLSVASVSLLFILSGCTTAEQQRQERQEQFEARLQRFVGENINRIIEFKGPPSQTYKMPSGDVSYTYERTSGPVTMLVPMGRFPMAVTNTFSCRLDLIVNGDNQVRTWRYEGNGCF